MCKCYNIPPEHFTSFLLNTDWLKKEYWNNQYKQRLKDGQSGGFDFLLSFDELYPQLQYLLPTKPYTFMNLGCGMSDFSVGLYQKTGLPSMIYEVDFAIEALKHSQRLFIQTYISPVNMDTISGEGCKASRKLACASLFKLWPNVFHSAMMGWMSYWTKVSFVHSTRRLFEPVDN